MFAIVFESKFGERNVDLGARTPLPAPPRPGSSSEGERVDNFRRRRGGRLRISVALIFFLDATLPRRGTAYASKKCYRRTADARTCEPRPLGATKGTRVAMAAGNGGECFRISLARKSQRVGITEETIIRRYVLSLSRLWPEKIEKMGDKRVS